jgi:hypothetical protein
MRIPATILAAVLAIAASAPAEAEVLRSKVAYNDSIKKKTSNQPADGVELTFQFAPKEGGLDGCTIDATEQAFPHDGGAWGFFNYVAKAACLGGDGFTFNGAGAWDGKGFYAAGIIVDGSGTGRFKGAKGRVPVLGGTSTPAANGTVDLAYDLVVDTAGKP